MLIRLLVICHRGHHHYRSIGQTREVPNQRPPESITETILRLDFAYSVRTEDNSLADPLIKAIDGARVRIPLRRLNAPAESVVSLFASSETNLQLKPNLNHLIVLFRAIHIKKSTGAHLPLTSAPTILPIRAWPARRRDGRRLGAGQRSLLLFLIFQRQLDDLEEKTYSLRTSPPQSRVSPLGITT